jgi:hypothetical protein
MIYKFGFSTFSVLVGLAHHANQERHSNLLWFKYLGVPTDEDNNVQRAHSASVGSKLHVESRNQLQDRSLREDINESLDESGAASPLTLGRGCMTIISCLARASMA